MQLNCVLGDLNIAECLAGDLTCLLGDLNVRS